MKRLVVEDKEGKRSKVIVFNHCQWEKIQGRVSKTVDQAIEAAAAAMEREERRLKSKEMADSWENTFVNLRKKRFQLRQERMADKEAEIQEKYKAMKREQEEIRKEIKRKAKEILFEQRDSTKMLRSAQNLSQVYKERDAQIEFEKTLKEKAKEEEKEEVQRIYKDVELFKEEEELKKKKYLGDKEKKKEELAIMMKEIEESKKEQKRKQLAEEREELQLMKAEIDVIKQHEKEELERKKNLCIQYMEDGMRYYRKYEAAKLEDERDEDKAIAIIARGKAIIAEKRKQREEEKLKKSIEKKREIANQLAEKLAQKDNVEDEIFEKAVAEKDAIWEANEKKRKEKEERLRKERVEAYMAYLCEDAGNKAQEHELFKWAVLQRLHNQEVTKNLDEELKRKKLKRLLHCQEINRQLTKEFNQKMALERQEDVDAVKRAIDLWLLDDKEFLEFADKIKHECKEKEMTIYPIDAVIHKYKVDNGLMRRKRGVGLVEVAPVYPLNVEPDRAPPKNKAAIARLKEMERKAEIKERDPKFKLIERKLNECLCVKPGGNGLDMEIKK